MSIIIENQSVEAGISFKSGALHIDFAEDPSFIRSESVILDLMHRSIGIIFQNTYHHLGNLPPEMGTKDLEHIGTVCLSGAGAGGHLVMLNAPVKILRKSA